VGGHSLQAASQDRTTKRKPHPTPPGPSASNRLAPTTLRSLRPTLGVSCGVVPLSACDGWPLVRLAACACWLRPVFGWCRVFWVGHAGREQQCSPGSVRRSRRTEGAQTARGERLRVCSRLRLPCWDGSRDQASFFGAGDENRTRTVSFGKSDQRERSSEI